MEAEARLAPILPPPGVMEAGARFTFAHMTHGILDVGIVPLSVQIMKKKKGCSGGPRPLEDGLDGSEAVTTIIKGVVRG